MKHVNIWWACAVATGLASSLAFGQSATTDCSTVANDGARLTCYDEQAGRRKGGSAAPSAASAPVAPTPVVPTPVAPTPATPAPRASTTPAAPVPPVPATPARAPQPVVREAPAAKPSTGSSDFGAESIQKPAQGSHAGGAEQISVRVSSVATMVRGYYRVTLEDGQVWEETQHTGGAPPEAGETVTIKRGALGSYFLARNAGGLALRVKRVH